MEADEFKKYCEEVKAQRFFYFLLSRMKEFRIFPEFRISHVIKLILRILKFEKYLTRKYRDRYIKMIRDQKTVQYQQITSD